MDVAPIDFQDDKDTLLLSKLIWIKPPVMDEDGSGAMMQANGLKVLTICTDLGGGGFFHLNDVWG